MSYGLQTPCFDCVKNDKCVDPQAIAAGINLCHTLGSAKGHLGGGNVKLECSQYVKREEATKL